MKTEKTSGRFTIVDAHCDSILDAAWGRRDLRGPTSDGHLDLERMTAAGIMVQFFAAFIEPEFKPRGPLERVLQLIDVFDSFIFQNPDLIEAAYDYKDILRILQANKTAALLTVEGGEAVLEDLAFLRILHRLGVRGITLTWNQRNAIGDGCGEGPAGGLSVFGRQVVEEMNRLGMIIDISHLNEGGVRDVLKYSKEPVIASHSNVRSLCDHPRNLYDYQIKSLAEKNGVICVTFVPDFLCPEGTAAVDDVVEHIDYLKKLVGCRHIGIGSDFDGTEEIAEGIGDAAGLPNLVKALEMKGYSEDQLERILGGNILRLIKDVLD